MKRKRSECELDNWFWVKLNTIGNLPMTKHDLISGSMLRNEGLSRERSAAILTTLLSRNTNRFEVVNGYVQYAQLKPVEVVIPPKADISKTVTESKTVSEKKMRVKGSVRRLNTSETADLTLLIRDHFVKGGYQTDAEFLEFAKTQLKFDLKLSHVTKRRNDENISLPKPSTPAQREQDLIDRVAKLETTVQLQQEIIEKMSHMVDHIITETGCGLPK